MLNGSLLASTLVLANLGHGGPDGMVWYGMVWYSVYMGNMYIWQLLVVAVRDDICK